MRADPELNSNPKLARKAKVGTGTVSRARNAAGGTTIDTVQAFADAFGVQPHELLAYPKLSGAREDRATYSSTDLDLKRVIEEWPVLTPTERAAIRGDVHARANHNRSVFTHLGSPPKMVDDQKKAPIDFERHRGMKKT